MFDWDALDFTKDGGPGSGFVTVVAQDDRTGAVLMVARADRAALERTIATGEMHYHSRTRGLWHKGRTSGNVQRVVSLAVDCDGDAVLARVIPAGPSCHTGAMTCFERSASGGPPPIGESVPGPADPHHQSVAAPIESSPPDVLDRLSRTIATRAAGMPLATATGSSRVGDSSYTQRLLSDRNLRLKKLGEEAAELAIACADGDRRQIIAEAADLVYHVLVALAGAGLTLDDLRTELAARER